MGPGNVLDGVHLHNDATWRIPSNRPYAAAMRPYVNLWPLVIAILTDGCPLSVWLLYFNTSKLNISSMRHAFVYSNYDESVATDSCLFIS